MRRDRRSENQRAESFGHLSRELWSRRPLSTWNKSAENKRLSMRLYRRKLARELDIEVNG